MKQVILAGVFSRLKDAEPLLAETEALCHAAEMNVVCTVLQQLNRPDPATVIQGAVNRPAGNAGSFCNFVECDSHR